MHYLISILFIFYSISAYCQTGCPLKAEKDSVKVYLCSLNTSKFKAVRSTFPVHGRFSELAAMVLDIDNYKEWQYNTISARVLKRISDHEIIYYTEVAAPLFTNNRDFIIQLSIAQNPVTKEMTIDLISLPDYLPPKENVIRVPYSKARWIVKPISTTELQVDYYIEIDLGGSVPAWLVNMVAHQAPLETFKDLRSKIGNYKNSKIPFIQDK